MTEHEYNQIIHELGIVQGELKGVQTSLDHGSVKMDNLLDMCRTYEERLQVLECSREFMHKDCDTIHRAVSEMCARNRVDSETKPSKITMSFSNLMKLLAFIAVVATCGMVAANSTGG